ncbi:MAG: glucosamine-6-phosphate deaminase [Acetatifactor sp.]|nr:glucosamine-6-phosphate deaminase [Acetatifactor sp.]
MQPYYDSLCVKTYDSREEMGAAAAKDAAACLRKLLEEKEEVSCMFAAAPSQNEFLAALLKEPGINWQRVHAFHMDEYCGLAQGSEGTFSRFLLDAVFDRKPFCSVNLINGEGDFEKECRRYEALLKKHPVDIVFMGIGENGHIAFNDPQVADFEDEAVVRKVELDGKCRRQQVNDGCFPSLEQVPAHALTVTVPGLMSAGYHFCIVPGIRKAEAVRDTLTGPVEESCPASILRLQTAACLYLDRESASLL